jgi:transposase
VAPGPFDSAKEKHAMAIVDDGHDGEVRYLGEIDNSPDAIKKLVVNHSGGASAGQLF